VSELALQTVLLLELILMLGVGKTVMVNKVELLHPLALVPFKVYVVVMDGLTAMLVLFEPPGNQV
jgi:hypothetical protein